MLTDCIRWLLPFARSFSGVAKSAGKLIESPDLTHLAAA
jgi:hypothetical protein